MAAAIAFSMLVALTISPMMASKLLSPRHDGSEKQKKGFAYRVDQAFAGLRRF
jgi:multidrug efflux pump subunit AcrB